MLSLDLMRMQETLRLLAASLRKASADQRLRSQVHLRLCLEVLDLQRWLSVIQSRLLGRLDEAARIALALIQLQALRVVRFHPLIYILPAIRPHSAQLESFLMLFPHVLEAFGVFGALPTVRAVVAGS